MMVMASAMLLSVLLPRLLWLRSRRCRHSVSFRAAASARPPASLICTAAAITCMCTQCLADKCWCRASDACMLQDG